MQPLAFLLILFVSAIAMVRAAPIEKRGFSGDGTFYTVGLGSCGTDDSDHDLVAALNAPQMGSNGNPNNNPNCGKKAKVKGPKGTVTVKIVSGKENKMLRIISHS